VLWNDGDPDGDPIRVTAINGTPVPAGGSATISLASDAVVTMYSDGSFIYTPPAGYVTPENAPDTFTYAVSDGVAAAVTGTASISVTNQAPIVSDEGYSILHDTTLTTYPEPYTSSPFGVLWNDGDPDGDLIKVTAINGTPVPASGSVTISLASNAVVMMSSDGSFIYTPPAGYVTPENAPDTFTYAVSDGVGAPVTGTASVSVTNQSPTPSQDDYSILHDTTLITYPHPYTSSPFGVLWNDSEPDGDNLTITGYTNPTQGLLSFNISNGSFTYEPPDHWTGQVSFTYTISDGVSSAEGTVNIFVEPSLENDSYTVHHGTDLSNAPSVLDNDVAPGNEELFVEYYTDPQNGVLFLFWTGEFFYSPNPGFVGTDYFSYTAATESGTIGSASVSIEVTNNEVVAMPDFFTGRHGNRLVGSGLFANDLSGAPPDGDSITLVNFSAAAYGTVSVYSDGSFSYDAPVGLVGEDVDSFSYTVTDGASSSSGTAYISLLNSAPVAAADVTLSTHPYSTPWRPALRPFLPTTPTATAMT
jgi:hypothetical protein